VVDWFRCAWWYRDRPRVLIPVWRFAVLLAAPQMKADALADGIEHGVRTAARELGQDVLVDDLLWHGSGYLDQFATGIEIGRGLMASAVSHTGLEDLDKVLQVMDAEVARYPRATWRKKQDEQEARPAESARRSARGRGSSRGSRHSPAGVSTPRKATAPDAEGDGEVRGFLRSTGYGWGAPCCSGARMVDLVDVGSLVQRLISRP
jgi:hypothetical protein